MAADERTGVADAVVEQLRARGHEPLAHGALSDAERDDWAWASEAAARDVAEGRAEQAVVCCWTGTGASIAANKVRGVRAALCADAATAAGARRWNDANVLALSLRTTSPAAAGGDPRRLVRRRAVADTDDRANVEHLAEIVVLADASKRTTPAASLLGHAAVLEQQVDVAEHLGQRQVGLGDRDVAPQRLGDLVGGARLLLDQAARSCSRAARAGRSARRSASTWSVTGSPWPGRTTLEVHRARLAQRRHVGQQRPRAPAAGLARAAAERPRDQRVGGDVA